MGAWFWRGVPEWVANIDCHRDLCGTLHRRLYRQFLLQQYLQRPRVDVLDMPGANKAIMGFNLIYLFDKVDKLRQLAADLEALDLPAPLVGETFPFDQAVEAIRTLQSGKTVGKVVLRVGDEVAE